MEKKFINEYDLIHILTFPFSKTSLFRLNQDKFVKDSVYRLKNEVIEIGAEEQYNYGKLFNHLNYIPTNYSREKHLEFLDVCNIEREDNSVSNYLCVSVLEHVPDIQVAVDEIYRTLIRGGRIILVIPFLYPVHDELDFWRLAPHGYEHLFRKFKIIEFAHLGARLSTISELLQRPRGKFWGFRQVVTKLLGWPLVLLSPILDRIDSYPTGYGLILEK